MKVFAWKTVENDGSTGYFYIINPAPGEIEETKQHKHTVNWTEVFERDLSYKTLSEMGKFLRKEKGIWMLPQDKVVPKGLLEAEGKKWKHPFSLNA